MRELALNILDIAQNSIRAEARRIDIAVTVSLADNLLTLTVGDDGCGMDEDFVRRVTDPFSTTRTTRPVGMGLPLLKMDAEQSGGAFRLESVKGKGTTVSTSYRLDHIDRPPLGDLAASVTMLINGAPEIRFVLHYKTDTAEFEFDTEELRQMMDGVPLDDPQVLNAVNALINENLKESNGGIIV